LQITPTNAANLEVILDSADGTSGLSLQDSSSTEVFQVDSDGNVVTKGCLRLDSSGVECTTAENLVVDGNLGIGTTTPSVQLDIEGSASSGGIDINNTAADGDPRLAFQHPSLYDRCG